jgi:hypothetical protein
MLGISTNFKQQKITRKYPNDLHEPLHQWQKFSFLPSHLGTKSTDWWHKSLNSSISQHRTCHRNSKERAGNFEASLRGSIALKILYNRAIIVDCYFEGSVSRAALQKVSFCLVN